MIYKCKMCGGDLDVQEGASVCVCAYCGTTQTVPNLDSEKKALVFGWANRLRLAAEFDEAARSYESIALQFPHEAEAYWGLVLCRYGVEYVEDPQTRRRIPTCHRSSLLRVQDDESYQAALRLADAYSRHVYEQEAAAIESVRSGIAVLASQCEPFDVFICYKESDAAGNRTEDSVLAQEIYQALINENLRVFFSRITLEDKLGTEYEPLIFSALHSARVMLVIGSREEYFNAVWVKNEWSRYLKLVEAGEEKTLIPCFKNMQPNAMPYQLAQLQGQDLGKLGYLQDLVRGVLKLTGAASSPVPAPSAPSKVFSADASSLVHRGIMALQDGEFKRADSFFERALDIDSRFAPAHLGKFLAKKRASSLESFREEIAPYDDRNFQRALKFADGDMRLKMNEALRINEQNIERERKAKELSERKQQEALEAQRQYAAACEQIELAIQADLEPLAVEVDYRYEPAIATLRGELGTIESSVLQERVKLRMEVARLQREQAALGAFDKARKAQYGQQIAAANERLDAIASIEEIREGYLSRINELMSQRDAEKVAMEQQVRARYPLPSLEQFHQQPPL